MIARRHTQAGVTLIVTLVMLVMLTLFALSAIRLANVNLRIVGNFQWHKEMETLADAAIEQVVSSAANFGLTPANQDICANGRAVSTGTCTLLNAKVGTVYAPRCSSTQTAPGYSKTDPMVFMDNTWIVSASAEDSWSGAKVTIVRGVVMRQLKDNCPE